MSSDSQEWTTAIAEVREDDVIVRGYALSELVGKATYTEAVFLVLTGELPTPARRDMLDAIFVALIEHGISPSTIITRMLTSCGTPTQAAIAGGVVSIADWHGGSGEQLGRDLAGMAVAVAGLPEGERQAALRAAAAAHVAGHRKRGERFEGFGHPQHPEGDPRALLLFGIARGLEVDGLHVRLVGILEEEIAAALGRPLRANVTGALAALLLDLGFPWQAIRGLVIAPRTAGLLAHVVEELEQGGRWRHVAAEHVQYTGPGRRPVPERR